MGFISNPADKALLRQPAYRSAVAAALADSLDRFLAPRRPSPGALATEAAASVLVLGRKLPPGSSGAAGRPREARAQPRPSRRPVRQAEDASLRGAFQQGAGHHPSGRAGCPVREDRNLEGGTAARRSG